MSDDVTELIRAAFERAAAADPPTSGGGVADAVRTAASRAEKKERAETKAKERELKEPKEPKEPRDRGRLVMALGGVGLALALVGGVLAVAIGGSSGAESLTTANQTVHMYRCPGSEPVGTLHRGDVVRSLARSQDDKWLAVTFPNDVAEQVWVPAKEVSSDVPASDLPVARCTAKNSVEIAGKKTSPAKSTPTTEAAKSHSNAGATTTTARAATQSTTTTLTVPVTAPPRGKGSNTGPAPTAPAPTNPPPPPAPRPTVPPTTVPPPPPTTTVPPDTTPPTIASVSSSPAQIYSNNGICSASTPKNSVITVVASDASGIESVSIVWKWNGVPYSDQNGATTRAMTPSGGSYVASFGKFGDVPKAGITLVVTVTVTDKAGNTATKKINIAVFSCHT
jgi:hypothetical protein